MKNCKFGKANRISSRVPSALDALVVALCGATCFVACADDKTKTGESQQALSAPLPLPLTVAPGALHAYLFDQYVAPGLVGDQGQGFGIGEAEQNDPGFLESGATLVANGSGSAVALSASANSYVQFPYDAGAFGTGDFTVLLDVNVGSTYNGADVDLVTNRDLDNHANFFDIRMHGTSGVVMVEVDQDTSGTNYNTVQGGAINDGQWHRVAAVRQGKQLSLAIDGVVVASQPGPGVADIEAYSTSGYGYNPFRLGTASFAPRAPTGTFDNLTVYDRALTAAELAGIAAPSAFQDFTAAPTAWTNVSGTWTWDGSQSLTVTTGTDGAVTWLPGLSASDFAVETHMKLNDYNGCAGLLIRGMNWTATNNGGQQYYVTLSPGLLIVGKNNNGWTELGQAAAPVVPGSYNTLRVEAIGSTLQVYIDDALYLSISDGSFATGGIGLKSYYGGATFDYVHVMPDLARGKATTQSATAFGGVPSRAVDGNNDGVYADGSITHTAIAEGQWWEVDLGQISSVTNLVVWSRAASDCSDCGNRLQNYDVETSVDGSNWTQNQFPGTVPQELVVQVDGAVRYVKVGHVSSSFGEPISLAEVTAWGTACGPDQIAGSNGSCTPCPAGLATTDGATCVSPLPLSPFGGADYVSRLVGVGTGLCMDAANTATVHPWPCSRHSDGWWLNQVADPTTGGTAYLVRTGQIRCLVAGAPGADGTATVQATAGAWWTTNTSAACGSTGALWQIAWNAAGQMQLRNEQTNLCLAVASGGSMLEARACTGESDELWNPDTLRPRAFTSPLVPRSSESSESVCLQLAATGGVPQFAVCQAQPTAAQALQFTALDDGSVLIQGDGGNCLTVDTSNPGAGAQLLSSGCYGPTWQRWAMVRLDGGGTSLVSLYTGYCVTFDSTSSGVSFVPLQEQCNGTDDQIFDQTQVTGAIPTRVTLEQIGSSTGTELVITGEAGVQVTTDPRAIAIVFQQAGLDLTDPTQLGQLLSLLNPQQGVTLTGYLNGPDGLGGSASYTWYPLDPAMDSASGSYNDGLDSGTFHLRPGSVGGTNTQNLGGGVSETIDWSLTYKGGVQINSYELDTPIGAAGFHLDLLQSLLSQGQVGVTVNLGSMNIGLSLGINGLSYTGPFSQYVGTATDYLNAGGAWDVQTIRRGAVDVFTASRSWGEYAYANVASWVAGVATDLTNDIASGYSDIASAATTAISAVENFFGTIGSWF